MPSSAGKILLDQDPAIVEAGAKAAVVAHRHLRPEEAREARAAVNSKPPKPSKLPYLPALVKPFALVKSPADGVAIKESVFSQPL